MKSMLSCQLTKAQELTVYHHQHLSLPQWGELITFFRKKRRLEVKVNFPSELEWMEPTRFETPTLYTDRFIWNPTNILYVAEHLSKVCSEITSTITIQVTSQLPLEAIMAWSVFKDDTIVVFQIFHTRVWSLPLWLIGNKPNYFFPKNTSCSDLNEQVKNLAVFGKLFMSCITFENNFEYKDGSLTVFRLDVKSPFLATLIKLFPVTQFSLEIKQPLHYAYTAMKALVFRWVKIWRSLSSIRFTRLGQDCFQYPSLYLRYVIPALYNHPDKPRFIAHSSWGFLWRWPIPRPCPAPELPITREDAVALQDWSESTGNSLLLPAITPGWLPLLPHCVATEATVDSLSLSQLSSIWRLRLKNPSLLWIQKKAKHLTCLIDLEWESPTESNYATLMPHLTLLRRLVMPLHRFAWDRPRANTNLTDVLRKHCTALTELSFLRFNSPNLYASSWAHDYLPPCLTSATMNTNFWNLFLQHHISTLATLKLDASMGTKLPELVLHSHLFQNVTQVSIDSMNSIPDCIRFLETLPNLTAFHGMSYGLQKGDQDLLLAFLKHQSTLTELYITSRSICLSDEIIQQVATRNQTLIQLTLPPTPIHVSEYFEQMPGLYEIK